MRRFAFALCFSLTAGAGQAFPGFYDKLVEKYAFAPDSAAAKAKCQVCHDGKPPRLNIFGKQVKGALGPEMVLSPELLAKIGAEDANGDGKTNDEDLAAGALPGGAGSTKSNAPGARSEREDDDDDDDEEGEEHTAPSSTSSELIPKHSMHPAMAHFPLALWAVAAFFELFGRYRKQKSYHDIAIANLGIGLIASIVTIGTGIAAMLRLGYWPLTANPMIIHLALASGSTLLALGAWSQRKKDGLGFLILLCLSAGSVLLAGHFGGDMVFAQ